jgi:hypothetical protein
MVRPDAYASHAAPGAGTRRGGGTSSNCPRATSTGSTAQPRSRARAAASATRRAGSSPARAATVTEIASRIGCRSTAWAGAAADPERRRAALLGGPARVGCFFFMAELRFQRDDARQIHTATRQSCQIAASRRVRMRLHGRSCRQTEVFSCRVIHPANSGRKRPLFHPSTSFAPPRQPSSV